MNNEISNRITTNQMKALRNFRVPDATIQALSKSQASELLTKLIEQAQSNGKSRPASHKVEVIDPYSQVRANLSEATKIVMEHFGIKDKSELREVHVALIQEVSRQVYGLKYWIGKLNTQLD